MCAPRREFVLKVRPTSNAALNNRRFVTVAALLAAAPLAGCGGGSSSQTPIVGTSGAGSTGTSQYAKAYQKAAWSSAATTVSFPSACSMTFTTSGTPPYHSDYYLAPVSTQYPTEVAETPVSKTPMSVVPYMASLITSQTVTINTCPQRASATTATNMGAIGYMISGEALFNPYEDGPDKIPAMSDNVSYTFTPSGGSEESASFIDSCNSHPTPLTGGYTWHHHGIPTCLVAQVDGATGPSHLIGFALDGFPIYGGRDVNGKVISVSQLDACNGITSATPEFPNGAYHYVLPVGVTGTHSSLNCYAGTPASP